ncbi:MAG: hypothetical protein B6U88_00780 [Candidatus Aenigmarchaeota archaeon ex4484_56]|nr:MAG: hypothetical protein B6U88_00780 [Candidatus Aenigmarchaeota archaeon ex4484_56]
MERYIFILLFILFICPVYAAYTCSDYWNHSCNSREYNDAFHPCSGIEKGGDEHIQEIYIDKKIVMPNNYQIAICTFVPTIYESVDEVYIYYYDGDKWTNLYSGIGEYKYPYNKTITFNVGSKEGEKIVRCIIDRDGEKDECANEGDHYDNDDIKFLVLKPIECKIFCSNKSYYYRNENICCNISCNKEFNVSYIHNGTGRESEYFVYGGSKTYNLKIPLINFIRGGKYFVDIFANHITKEKIYSMNISLVDEVKIGYVNFSDVIEINKKEKVECSVLDKYTDTKINDFPVSFYIDGKKVSENSTIDGVASYEIEVNTFGYHNISCLVNAAEDTDIKTKKFYVAEKKTDLNKINELQNKIGKLENKYINIKLSAEENNLNYETELSKIHENINKLNTYLNKGDLLNFEIEYRNIDSKLDNIKREIFVFKIKNFFGKYAAIIFSLLIISISSILFYFRILIPYIKQKKNLEYFLRKEKELIEKRREIEREYFSRKISEEYFNKMMVDLQNKLTEVRAQIKKLKK